MAATRDVLAVSAVLTLCLLLFPLSGWWLAARLRGDPLERFTAACLAGVVSLAGVEMLVYALALPQWVAVSAVATFCLASARDLGAAFRSREFAWRALLAWGGTAAILVAATLCYEVHGHDYGYGDWFEHWRRSLIFLSRSPITTRVGHYSMASRAPLFNAASAWLMSLLGSRHYWVFQIVAIALNTLICLPFALILEAVGGLSRRASLFVAASVCLLVPFFFWNNTLTWPKDLTAAFVLMGIYKYLTAYRKGQAAGMARSLLWLAAGILTHFLALLYGVTLGLHLLYVKRRDLPVRELIRVFVLAAVLVGPWFGYLFLAFGVKGTLTANTTLGDYYASGAPQARVLIVNLCSDLLPMSFCRPLTPPPARMECQEVAVAGATATPVPAPCPPALRRNGIYAILGYSGMAAILLATVGLLRAGPVPQGRFLLWLLAGGLLLNLLPIRWFDVLGTFPENLQAWCLLLFALAVRGLVRLPRLALFAVVLAMFAEYAAFDLDSIRRQATVLPLAIYETALRGNPPIGSWLPDPAAGFPFRTTYVHYNNYMLKVEGGAVYFRDLHPNTFPVASWLLLGAGILALAVVPTREKEKP